MELLAAIEKPVAPSVLLEEIRRFNAEALTGSGYHVEAAVDGAAGWEALNANRYDLLITDNNMPNLTGVELIKKLNDARMSVRVILASGLEYTEQVQELRLAATLPKPFTLDELLGTVKKVLGEADGGERMPTPNQPPVDPWRV